MIAGRLLVVCKDDQSLQVIDLGTGATVGHVRASAFTPHEVAASADGTRAYLPVYSDAWLGDVGTDGRWIDVVDLVDLRLVDGIPMEGPSRPHDVAVGADGRVFVSTELDESVSVVDPASRKRVARLPTGRPQSHMFVTSPDGSRVYSANVDSGSVSVIDVATESLLEVIDVADRINRISITPDGSTLFTADQQQPRVAAIDVASTAVTWLDLPSIGFGTAVTRDGRSLAVALRSASQIAVIDLVEREVVAVVDVPLQPQAMVVHPDGTHAYSAGDAARKVVELDLRRREVSRVFETGAGADGICWAPQPPGLTRTRGARAASASSSRAARPRPRSRA